VYNSQGHSLGGSLATLLMLMYLRRGVLPAVAISPVYTFGAPAIFCEANCSCSSEGSAGHCHHQSTIKIPSICETHTDYRTNN